ncbi:MAG: hypothetical protein IJ761_04665 [Bacteroidales bacterium]|nr:hypothetical protein [Bacteroidales bacterium]
MNDNEIRVIGGRGQRGSKKRFLWWALFVVAVAVIVILWLVVPHQSPSTEPDARPDDAVGATAEASLLIDNADPSMPAATVVCDTVVDNLHLRIFTPYNATPELHVGHLSRQDTNVVLAAMAADLRRDNGRIVGAFVQEGQPLSWGLSKKGYCAIIDGRITIGVAENSPLFEQATEQEGYFFRQYPSVKEGKSLENNPENASFRRALCTMGGRVCIVACTDRVLMNEFSTALAHLGVSDAIFLVGGTAEGWCRDSEGKLVIIGTSTLKKSKYINYIVFRKQ